ncbi:M20/M25/M40 family metallo-hydrolase [Paenibacillus pasadenensis]|uniref:M20/M25/M40 family metallo-hydrolase n=1 Tax=Paenibacillus TaxID=44249 RepID=UPI0003FD169D|nr:MULTISPECIES: M20/M25/M40 family metallo-hydrolase [Paenibacillus]
MSAARLFTDEHAELLLALLRLDTVSPLESDAPGRLPEAQQAYAAFAARRTGAAQLLLAPAPPEALRRDGVPLSVLRQAERMGEQAFLAAQPNLLLRIGRERPREETIAFNFHMDTVADGGQEIGFDGVRFYGRGSADMKGAGVALLAGIEAALAEDPELAERCSVLVQSVCGEEGGAMGVCGTRELAELGHVGALNVFAEPSGGVWFDRSTTSMTARVEMFGEDATDDAPQAGHNATLLLGQVGAALLRGLAEPARELGGKVCLAGLHTGGMHNKVYGTGTLLLNIAYPSAFAGEKLRLLTERCARDALLRFADEWADVPEARRTARDATRLCRLSWVKSGLPVLDNRHPAWERLLSGLGWERNPDDRPERAFTCDAMWMMAKGCYTVVYGPGSLEGNGAHTARESMELAELERYAGQIKELLLAFARTARRKRQLERTGSA